MRLLSYVKPYKFRALALDCGVVGGAMLLNYQPAIIANGRRRRPRRRH